MPRRLYALQIKYDRGRYARYDASDGEWFDRNQRAYAHYVEARRDWDLLRARCLELFDQLAAREAHKISVTKRGRIVAVLTPPNATAGLLGLHGFMRGSVEVPEAVDLSAAAPHPKAVV